MLSHHRVVMLARYPLEQRTIPNLTAPSEEGDGVARETLARRSLQGGALGQRPKALLVEIDELFERQLAPALERQVARRHSALARAVVRANILTSVAAEQMFADAEALVGRHRAAQLDGEIRDTPPRIEHEGA